MQQGPDLLRGILLTLRIEDVSLSRRIFNVFAGLFVVVARIDRCAAADETE